MAKRLFLILVCVVISSATGCSRNNGIKEVSFSGKAYSEDAKQPPEQGPIRIAAGCINSHKAGFEYYKHLLNYIGEKLGRKIEFIDREDYTAINKMLQDKEIDVAFVSSGPYVSGYDEFGLELLAVPQVAGETVYYSYIIVPEESNVNSFNGLRGKTFAFIDPLSNSGKLIPTYMLARMNETPESFFKYFHYTHAHDRSIKEVATGIIDGAAVDSFIWEYENRIDPVFTSKTKIIGKSPPHANPPVVIRHGIELELKEKLRRIFLNVHNDAIGREILKKMMIDKFVLIDDKAYDSIRAMKQWLNKQEEKKK